jgi:hypothetical protein
LGFNLNDYKEFIEGIMLTSLVVKTVAGASVVIVYSTEERLMEDLIGTGTELLLFEGTQKCV